MHLPAYPRRVLPAAAAAGARINRSSTAAREEEDDDDEEEEEGAGLHANLVAHTFLIQETPMFPRQAQDSLRPRNQNRPLRSCVNRASSWVQHPQSCSGLSAGGATLRLRETFWVRKNAASVAAFL